MGNRLFCAPLNASEVLTIDVDQEAKTETVLTIDCRVAGEDKWRSLVAVGTKVICAPRDASELLILEDRLVAWGL